MFIDFSKYLTRGLTPSVFIQEIGGVLLKLCSLLIRNRLTLSLSFVNLDLIT